MPVFSFKTIVRPSEGSFREKGSRFLAFALPVANEQEIKDHLGALRKKYHDARHQGYAYVLGPEKKLWRAFDDGEPNHSTGDPILGQIRSQQLTDILVVVVRYFGGTKLGMSGLISAYKTAAADALRKATIVEKEVVSPLEVIFDFDATPAIMRMIKEFELNISAQEFTDRTRLKLDVPLRVKELVVARLAVLKTKGAAIHWNEVLD